MDVDQSRLLPTQTGVSTSQSTLDPTILYQVPFESQFYPLSVLSGKQVGEVGHSLPDPTHPLGHSYLLFSNVWNSGRGRPFFTPYFKFPWGKRRKKLVFVEGV